MPQGAENDEDGKMKRVCEIANHEVKERKKINRFNILTT
jgi:hypothetical protein